MSSTDATNWQQEAHLCLLQGNYDRAASLYEQAIAYGTSATIASQPDIRSHYWHLGLMLLLQGQEAEAQMTWMLGMEEGDPEQIENWTKQLIEVLQTEAERQEILADNSVAWGIRQHIREINSTDINNLLHLIQLAIKLNSFTGEELNSLGAIETLQSQQLLALDSDLLMQVLRLVLDTDPLHPSSLEFAEACIPYIREPYIFLDILILIY